MKRALKYAKYAGIAVVGAILGTMFIAWAAPGSLVMITDMAGNVATITNGALNTSAGGGGGTQNVNLLQTNSAALAAATAGYVPVEINPAQGLAVTGSVSIVGPMVATIADCADVTKGCLADAKSTATDTTAISQMSVLKQISASVQAPPAAGAQPAPVTSGGLSTCYLQATASTNATNCKNAAGQVYHIRVVGNGTTIGYLRMYNLSAAPTCTSATGLQDAVPVPQPAAGGGGGFVEDIGMGEAFSTGIGFCFSGGIGTTDNTNVAATTWQITVMYK